MLLGSGKALPRQAVDAIEEMNLLEFPLVLLADRVPTGLKTLTFEDAIRDSSTGEQVQRKVIVSAPDALTLPNATDQDILLALMKHASEQNGFRKREVPFTLYQICKQLRWGTSGQETNRIRDALDRWNGLWISVDGWRRKHKWTKEGFHIIDYQRLSLGRDKDPDEDQIFEWNRVVLESFQQQNTKPLDWEFYLSLERSTSKRLYRFLDKRFHLSSSWSWDGPTFATEKIGLSRNLKPHRYKDKLTPAITELEERGFLAPMDPKKRFKKVGKGLYVVNFTRRRQTAKPKPKPLWSGALAELQTRGVRPDEFKGHGEEQIREAIEVHDDLVARKDERISKNPAGYLAAYLRNGWKPHSGFKTAAQREAEKKTAIEKLRAKAKKDAEEKAALDKDKRGRQEQWAQFIKRRNRFSQAEQIRLEDDALSNLGKFQQERLITARRKGEVGLHHLELWERHIFPKQN